MKHEVISEAYAPFIENIKTYFHKKADNLIWDRRNKIKIIPFKDEKMVVKSFKIPHLLNRVVYQFFRDSKAKKSYLNSLRIKAFVPEPIGYTVFTKMGLVYDSYFVSREYVYDFTIREPLTQDDFDEKEKIFDAFAQFTYDLHEQGAEHLDYSPGNILIKKISDGYALKVIDVNRMKFRTLSSKQRVENFSKLWAKESDLSIIVKSYAKYANIDEKQAIENALAASKAHKAKKNLKKRLRGKKVVD